MTLLPKNALIAGTINLGNYDNFRFEFGAEINTAEDYLELVEFAASSLIGQFRGADPQTQETVRAYVARLCSIEEAQVPCMQPPAPAPAKASTPATFDRVSPPPKQMPAPPVADAVSRQQHAAKLMADLNRLQADHNARVAASKVPTAAEQAAAAVAQIIKPPAAATKSEASDPYDLVICERCGAETTKAQAKLSQLFMSQTLCKKCMDSPGGSA